jgi:flagellin
MALNNISLTAGMRANLLSLQNTAKMFDTTQTRLATGKKVNTALDDPIAYFAAKGYMDRANDLSGLKDSMNEAIQIIKAADAGITAIEDLVAQAKSLANSALATADATERTAFATQYNAILDQIDFLADDSNFKGTNLLENETLSVVFDETGDSTLSITGFSADSAGLTLANAQASWAADTDIDADIARLTAASSTLRTESKGLSSSLSIVNTRLEFTSQMMSALTGAADTLTLADMNEEGANLLMLQTRQSLSVTALSLSSQSAQSILRLF